MKNKFKLTFVLTTSAALIITAIVALFPQEESREDYEARIKEHPFYTNILSQSELESLPKEDRPDLAWQQDFLFTMNPTLGRPTPEKLFGLRERINESLKRLGKVPGDNVNPWIEHGPDNVGGRTRAILFDPNDPTHKKVWAGGVTGGLWYTNDITNTDSSWRNVNDFWDNIAVSAIAADPTNSQVFYVGTGEGWRQSVSGAPGAGVWKTEDGGKTWNQLKATEDYHYVNDLIVRDENGTGVLYVGTDFSSQRFVSKPGAEIVGLYRSTDGGQTFDRQSLEDNSSFRVADLEIGADNRLWVGTYFNNGKVVYSDDGTTWKVAVEFDGERRVEVACAPSNANYVYALFEKGGKCERIELTTDNGANWNTLSEPADADGGIPDDDFTRGQAWYDLILAVDPTDENTVIAGGINLFISKDAGDNWNQVSHWYGGFGYPYVHADQHQIVFRPGSNGKEVVFGNDGGLFYSSDISVAEPQFEHRVRNYNTVQFYACAIHPEAENPYFLAGSQDNGTQRFNQNGLNSTVRVTGGDGAYCHIDQENPDYQITSYVYNRYYYSTDAGNDFNRMYWDGDRTGWFINPTDYDDHHKILYAPFQGDSLLKVVNIDLAPTDAYISYDFGTKATAIKVSDFTTSSSTVFVGTIGGRIFKISNAETDEPTVEELTVAALPNGAVSCIETGRNEDELLVSYHNYGVTSVWYSNNGGGSWSVKEGDLPDFPVRSILMNPRDPDNVILATELGVWSSSNFLSGSPNWSSASNGMANVRVDQFKFRRSDYTVVAASHGRGLFSSTGFLFSPATVTAQPEGDSVCINSSARIRATVSGVQPMDYQWYRNGEKIDGATDAVLNIDEVGFADTGSYFLVAQNGDGIDTSENAFLRLYDVPTPDLGPDITIRPEVTLELDPGDGYRTYIWSRSSTQQVLKVKGEELGIGTHEIICTVYTFDLCLARDTIEITVDETASLTEQPSVKVSIYPNPVSDLLQVQDLPNGKPIKIYNLNGQEVKSTTNANINVSDLAKGNYILQAAGQRIKFEKL